MKYELATLIQALDSYSYILVADAENGEMEVRSNIAEVLGFSKERAKRYPFIEKGSKKQVRKFLKACLIQLDNEKEIEDEDEAKEAKE